MEAFWNFRADTYYHVEFALLESALTILSKNIMINSNKCRSYKCSDKASYL